MADQFFIKIDTSPASDSWGFVGRVLVGDQEAYRTIRAYPTPGEALSAAQQLMGGVLGSLLAGEEWRSAQEEFGRAPRRTDLEFGLSAKTDRGEPGTTPPPWDEDRVGSEDGRRSG